MPFRIAGQLASLQLPLGFDGLLKYGEWRRRIWTQEIKRTWKTTRIQVSGLLNLKTWGLGPPRSRTLPPGTSTRIFPAQPPQTPQCSPSQRQSAGKAGPEAVNNSGCCPFRPFCQRLPGLPFPSCQRQAGMCRAPNHPIPQPGIETVASATGSE